MARRTLKGHDGKEFAFVAHPQETGGGFSYSVQMSEKKGDTIHWDLKPGESLTDEEIIVGREYFLYLRSLREATEDGS